MRYHYSHLYDEKPLLDQQEGAELITVLIGR